MQVLVTGGAGFVGTTLVPELLAQGYDVRVMDSLRFGGDALLPFFRKPRFSFVDGDVCDRARLAEAAQGCDAIVHLAAVVGFPACRKFPDDAQSTNVEGSRNVAAVALTRSDAGARCSYGARSRQESRHAPARE